MHDAKLKIKDQRQNVLDFTIMLPLDGRFLRHFVARFHFEYDIFWVELPLSTFIKCSFVFSWETLFGYALMFFIAEQIRFSIMTLEF